MTRPLNELARVLAREIIFSLEHCNTAKEEIDLAERKIIDGMRAALAGPTEAMITAAIRDKTPVNVDSFLNTRHRLCESVFNAMVAVRLDDLR